MATKKRTISVVISISTDSRVQGNEQLLFSFSHIVKMILEGNLTISVDKVALNPEQLCLTL